MKEYTTEREGQLAFYEAFLPRIGINISLDDILTNYTDGIVNGNILEFKLSISNLDATLFQVIKYLSSMRIKGISIPATILLIDLNAEIAYEYASEDYLPFIEQVYVGAASKNNAGLVGGGPKAIYKYGTSYDESLLHTSKLVNVLKTQNYTKIHIDENCIVGWAERFYREVPNSRKEDFIGDNTGLHKKEGEIRHPIHFKNFIYPYEGSSNVKFNYLMDKLNDFLQKKNLGAFYTPDLYAEKSVELVRIAINRVPEGNDYVIIDRCAGTGNLERHLSDEELSHCIVSTVEYYEYKILQEILGSKVREIIPPKEESDTFNAGLVNGADALSKQYVENPIIRQYIDNPNCTIILFENPPYAETTSVEHQKKNAGRASSTWKTSYVVTEMKKHVKGTASNEMGNAFIWSGFNCYLRQPTDSYIVYSPAKYWKVHHLVNKKLLAGYAFNRRHFHTNIDACIMCALWSDEDEETEKFDLTGWEIENGKLLPEGQLLPIKRLHSLYSQVYYDKRTFESDNATTVICGYNGLPPREGVKISIKPICNSNILGYMVIDGSNFDNPDLMSVLIRCPLYKGHGFYLRKDNYLEKLPMFAASRYITYNRKWTERGRIMKSADGADKFARDVANGTLKPFLLKCLLFTCLEMQNHMRTLSGSDGRFYRNELCLDNTNGETIATRDLASMNLNDSEKQLLAQWDKLINLAKQTENYKPAYTYGVYQIFDELNTSKKDESTGRIIYDYVELNSALQGLKNMVKEYYNREIVPTLFQYEFLK